MYKHKNLNNKIKTHITFRKFKGLKFFIMPIL